MIVIPGKHFFDPEKILKEGFIIGGSGTEGCIETDYKWRGYEVIKVKETNKNKIIREYLKIYKDEQLLFEIDI